MANKGFYETMATEHRMVWLSGSFVTAGTGSPTVVAGDVTSVARDSAGQFSVTLKKAYPQEPYYSAVNVVGTAGTQGYIEATDVQNKDITVQIRNSTDADADSTGETVQVLLYVRNSTIVTR